MAAKVTLPFYQDEWDTIQTVADLGDEAVLRELRVVPRKFLWFWKRWGWMTADGRQSLTGWASTFNEAVLNSVLSARWAERYGHPIGKPTGTVGKGCPDCVRGLEWAAWMEAWIECDKCNGKGIFPPDSQKDLSR